MARFLARVFLLLDLFCRSMIFLDLDLLGFLLVLEVLIWIG